MSGDADNGLAPIPTALTPAARRISVGSRNSVMDWRMNANREYGLAYGGGLGTAR